MHNIFGHRFTHDQQVSLLFAGAAAIIGIFTAAIWSYLEDSPGVILAYITAGLLVMAVVHAWKAPRSFVLLALLSVPAFIILALLHNLGYALAEITKAYPLISGFFAVLDGVAFFAAAVLAPAAAIVAVAGAIVTWFRNRQTAKE